MSNEENKRGEGLLGALASLPKVSSGYGAGLGLIDFFGRPEVKSMYFNSKTVVLDGYKFIGCRFDNCVLEVSSLNFDLIRCVVDPTTKISYGAEVAKVIQLFNSRYSWAYEHFSPAFVPIRNADGSITISDHAA